MSLRHAALHALITSPSPSAWNKIRAHLDEMSDDDVLSLPKPKLLFKDWPQNLSRPPLKTWTTGNPRLAYCLQCREVDTYDAFRLAVARATDDRCQLHRQVVGQFVPYSVVERVLPILRRGDAAGALKLLQGARPVAVGFEGQADLGGYVTLPSGLAAHVQVEVKMARGSESDAQTTRRELLAERGVCAIVAKDPEEAGRAVAEWARSSEGPVTKDDIRRQRDKALDAIPSWRPIAIAPTDGRYVIAKGEATLPIAVRYQAGRWCNQRGQEESNLSEWMELPNQ